MYDVQAMKRAKEYLNALEQEAFGLGVELEVTTAWKPRHLPLVM
jgi:hypothetical protein